MLKRRLWCPVCFCLLGYLLCLLCESQQNSGKYRKNVIIFLVDFSELILVEVFKCFFFISHGLTRAFSYHLIDNSSKKWCYLKFNSSPIYCSLKIRNWYFPSNFAEIFYISLYVFLVFTRLFPGTLFLLYFINY